VSGQRLEVITSLLGQHLLGVPLERVAAINDQPAADTAPVDLAGLWRVAPDAGQRRTITVQTSGGPLRVLLGTHARVRRLAMSAVTALPTFIDGLARNAGICGVFILDQTMGFLIDVDRLADWTLP